MLPDHLSFAKILTLSVVSFLIALALGSVWQRLLIRFKLSKTIRSGAPVFEAIHAKKAGTPTMGGTLFLATTLLLALFFFLTNLFFDGPFGFLNFVSRPETLLPLGALIAAAIVGGLDDIFNIMRVGAHGGGIGTREKFIVYFSVALFGAWWFYFKLWKDSVTIPFIGTVDLGFWYFPYAMLVILATTLSMNEADGLDGLSSGVGSIALGALGVVAILSGQVMLATLIGVLIGALMGYLWYNIYPARFFMGDVGSTALGVFLGVTALLTDTGLYLPLFAPILVIESLSVIVQKVWKRVYHKKLFLSTPIHHHFEAVGVQEPTIVMRMWLISGLFASLGLLVYFLNIKP